MIIERYFKGVLIKVVPRVLKEVHGSFIVFQERMVCETRKFQRCSRGILKMIKGCFKVVVIKVFQ